MAYKFYDLGLKGEEIKRRLALLENIYSDNNGVATKQDLAEVNKNISDL